MNSAILCLLLVIKDGMEVWDFHLYAFLWWYLRCLERPLAFLVQVQVRHQTKEGVPQTVAEYC